MPAAERLRLFYDIEAVRVIRAVLDVITLTGFHYNLIAKGKPKNLKQNDKSEEPLKVNVRMKINAEGKKMITVIMTSPN